MAKLPPTTPAPKPQDHSKLLWIVAAIIAVCLIGLLCSKSSNSQAEKERAALTLKKQKEEQAKAKAKAKAEAKAKAKAKAEAEARAKAEAKAKAEAEAKAATEAAAAAEESPQAEVETDSEPSEGEETDAATESGETEEVIHTPEEELDGDAEITPGHKLTIIKPTDEDNALYFSMLDEAVKQNDYLSLRDHLKIALDIAYPQLLAEPVEGGEAAEGVEAEAVAATDEATGEEAAPKPKKGKKGKKGRKADDEALAADQGPQLPQLDKKASALAKSVYSVYLCLDMALMNPPQDDAPAEDAADDEAPAKGRKAAPKLSKQDAFCAWLVSAKGKAANTFVQCLGKYKVTSRDEAVDRIDKLREFHAAEPKKAMKEIPAIVNPVAGKVSKKFYPRPDKKKIDEEIAKILKRKDKGNSKDEQASVNILNVYRYLCGVNPNVEHSAEFGEQARKAAAACHRNNGLSHALGDFTEVCNLAGGSQAAGTVPVYMDDFGDTNRKQRGHRMWCLHPQLGKCGFGVHEHYTAMRVTDTSNPKPITTAYSYPGRGFYPADYMHGDGWGYYGASGTDLGGEPKVEMWKLNGSIKEKPKATQLKASNAVEIKAIFPNGHYVIFEPDLAVVRKKVKSKGQEVEKFAGTYWIRITGSNGKVVDEYVVDFY